MVTFPSERIASSTNPHLNGVIALATSIPNIIAAKQVDNVEDPDVRYSLAHEYTMMRQVNSAMARIGVRAFPQVYSLYSCSEGGVREYLITDDDDDRNRHQKIDLMEGMGRNVCGSRQSTVMLMELLRGQELYGSTITLDQLNVTLAYLHGILSYLWETLEFCHGDLYERNIFLDHYNSGRLFNLPILASNGTVLEWVQLPFVPIIADLGMAVSRELAQWGSLAAPYPSQIQDIYNLYTRAYTFRDETRVNLYTSTVGFRYMKPIIDRYFLDSSWNSQEARSGEYIFMGMIAVGPPDLTHAELVQQYIKSGALDLYRVNGPEPRLEGDIVLIPIEKRIYPAIAARARYLLEQFESLSDPNTIGAVYIQNYLSEVQTHYSK